MKQKYAFYPNITTHSKLPTELQATFYAPSYYPSEIARPYIEYVNFLLYDDQAVYVEVLDPLGEQFTVTIELEAFWDYHETPPGWKKCHTYLYRGGRWGDELEQLPRDEYLRELESYEVVETILEVFKAEPFRLDAEAIVEPI